MGITYFAKSLKLILAYNLCEDIDKLIFNVATVSLATTYILVVLCFSFDSCLDSRVILKIVKKMYYCKLFFEKNLDYII